MSERIRRWTILHPEWEVRKAVNRDRLTGGPIARLADRLTAPVENALELWEPLIRIEALPDLLAEPIERFVDFLFQELDAYDAWLAAPIVLPAEIAGLR